MNSMFFGGQKRCSLTLIKLNDGNGYDVKRIK